MNNEKATSFTVILDHQTGQSILKINDVESEIGTLVIEYNDGNTNISFGCSKDPHLFKLQNKLNKEKNK